MLAIEDQFVSTTQIMNVVNLAKQTGILIFYEDRTETKPYAELIFERGKLLFATIRNRPDDLVSILLRAGKLNDLQAHHIRLRFHAATDKSMAIQLIAANFVTKRDIVNSVRQHTIEIALDLLGWDRGTVKFNQNPPTLQDRVFVAIELGNLLVESSKPTQEQVELEKRLPDLDQVIRFNPASVESLEPLRLSTVMWRILGYASGKLSIRQIGALCNITDTEIRSMVIEMLDAKLIEIVQPEAESDENRRMNFLQKMGIKRERMRQIEQQAYSQVHQPRVSIG